MVQNYPLVPEANELLAILGRFDLDGLLQSHDEIARLCGVYEPVVPVIIPYQHSVSDSLLTSVTNDLRSERPITLTLLPITSILQVAFWSLSREPD